LKKKVILTGGLGFLGTHFADVLINCGYDLIIIDKINPKNKIQKEIVKKSYKFLKVDITSESNVLKAFKKLKKDQVEILINNAAIDSIPITYEKLNHLPNVKNWNKELSVSLTGSYLMIKNFGEQMNKRKSGKIINIGSDLSYIAPNQDLYSDVKNFLKPVTYSVIKHGLLGMTKYFSSLYAKNNVQVNMLSPGPIYNNQNKLFIKKLLNFIPSKKMASRSDLTDGLLFLIKKTNSYYTGQNLIIDGGRTII
jgi:NAD(P)-dependent dehydrogenase (short-subunit alcohol dehydrogenase family)